jgi:hypothetical protein
MRNLCALVVAGAIALTYVSGRACGSEACAQDSNGQYFCASEDGFECVAHGSSCDSTACPGLPGGLWGRLEGVFGLGDNCKGFGIRRTSANHFASEPDRVRVLALIQPNAPAELVASTFGISPLLRSATVKNWSTLSIARLEFRRLDVYRDGGLTLSEPFSVRVNEPIVAGATRPLVVDADAPANRKVIQSIASAAFFVSVVTFSDGSEWRENENRVLSEARAAVGVRHAVIAP